MIGGKAWFSISSEWGRILLILLIYMRTQMWRVIQSGHTWLSWEKFIIALCFGLFPRSDKRWTWKAEARLCSCPFSVTVTASWWCLAYRAFFTIAFQTCRLCPGGATGTCSSLLLSSPSVAEQDTETASIALQCFELDTWTLWITHVFCSGDGRPNFSWPSVCAKQAWHVTAGSAASLACHSRQCSKPCVLQWAM